MVLQSACLSFCGGRQGTAGLIPPHAPDGAATGEPGLQRPVGAARPTGRDLHWLLQGGLSSLRRASGSSPTGAPQKCPCPSVFPVPSSPRPLPRAPVSEPGRGALCLEHLRCAHPWTVTGAKLGPRPQMFSSGWGARAHTEALGASDTEPVPAAMPRHGPAGGGLQR